MEFEDEDEEEDNAQQGPSYKAMDDDRLIEINKNIH